MPALVQRLSTPRRLGFAFLAAALAVPFWAALFARTGHGDVDLYHAYASAFWTGDPPFAQLPLEYPPLAIVPFSLTLLPPVDWYPFVFGAWMAAALVAAVVAYRRLISPRAALLLALYTAVGGLGTVLGRYDLIPALATVGALVALHRRRFSTAYILLAVGVLLKLYPAVLLPVLVIEHRRALGWPAGGNLLPRPVLEGIARFAFVVACGFGVALALTGGDALSPFRYAFTRPVQVESVPATVLWLLSFLGYPVTSDHSYGSFNVLSGLGHAVGAISELALVCGCLLVYWRQLRGLLSPGRAFVACICIVLATSKVFSPQYILWLLPLAAAEEFDPAWLVLAACTTLIFPFGYELGGVAGSPTVAYAPWFLALVGLRNVVMVALAWRMLEPRPVAAPAQVLAPVRR